MKYQWNARRTRIWAAHIAVFAPALYVFRDNADVLAGILVATAAYHAYRLWFVHSCRDSYGELNMFHVAFVAPLLFLLARAGASDHIALVAGLMATYFVGKFALYGTCTGRLPGLAEK